jgi:hypothetical protein
LTKNMVISETAAQTVVFLEELAKIVEKSLVTYSKAAAEELAGHIRGMSEAVESDTHVDRIVLARCREYAALDWRSELLAVMVPKDHRAALA